MERPITRLEKILRILYLMCINIPSTFIHPTNHSSPNPEPEDPHEPSVFYPSVYASPSSSPRSVAEFPESPELEIGSQLNTSPS